MSPLRAAVSETSPAKSTKIQARNKQRILAAAEEMFALYGFRGTTIDQIAKRAEMSKPNLLYYFKTKRVLYLAVLERILEIWVDSLMTLEPEMDPQSALRAYIVQKLELSHRYPLASRVFANEIIQGAPILYPILVSNLKPRVEKKVKVIQSWIDNGKMAPIEPIHLIFMIWATTPALCGFRCAGETAA